MKYLYLSVNLLLAGALLFWLWISGGVPAANSLFYATVLAAPILLNLVIWALSKKKRKQKPRQFEGVERRCYFRVVYAPKTRPTLHIADKDFEIADISQRGLRFINHQGIHLDQTIAGTVTFQDGQALDITGNVEWKKDTEISILLQGLIPHTTISKERYYASLN